MKIISQSIGK